MLNITIDLSGSAQAIGSGVTRLPERVADFEQQLMGQNGFGAVGSNLGGNFGGLQLGENNIASLTGLAMMANGMLEGMAGQLLMLSGGASVPQPQSQPNGSGLGTIVAELGQIAQELAQITASLGGTPGTPVRSGGPAQGAALTTGTGPGGGIAGMTPEGLDFIYQHEHEDGHMIEHPTAGSGVTIGAGYDISQKSRDEVRRDLMNAGASADVANKLAEGVGLTGSAADSFVSANKSLLAGMGKDFELRLIAPELESCAKVVDSASGGQLTPHQRDALISYVFNVGEGGFKKGEAYAALKRGDLRGVAEGLKGGITSDGCGTCAGLVKRRQEEAQLFES